MLKRLTLTALLAGFVAYPSAGFSDPETKPITTALEHFVQTAPRSTEVWDEKTIPLLSIESIERLTATTRVVHACEFQPTLLGPGVKIEAILVKQHRDFRVTSLTYAGACNVKETR